MAVGWEDDENGRNFKRGKPYEKGEEPLLARCGLEWQQPVSGIRKPVEKKKSEAGMVNVTAVKSLEPRFTKERVGASAGASARNGQKRNRHLP